MKVQEKRIFISDLPESATQADIEAEFKTFGSVVSVEIKKRKEVTRNNYSSLFAYINIAIDDKNLQKCFQHFSTTKWFGQHVVLQIARESFLDRLKRERQESNKKYTAEQEDSAEVSPHSLSNGINRNISRHKSSESEASENNLNILKDAKKVLSKEDILEYNDQGNKKSIEGSLNAEEITDYIIINNKGKTLSTKGVFKIETTSNTNVINDKLPEKLTASQSEANLKRLKSLNNLKKNYRNQKSIIQSALSQVDTYSKNKIIFEDDASLEKSKDELSKKHLFDDNDQSDDEINVDFSIKEHFQGKEGQKLLSLQSRYKNDKRFALDSRFVDNHGEKEDVTNEENEENSLKEEKQKEYEILADILGKDITKFKPMDIIKSQKKAMLRFDPTQPEHSKFEMKQEVEKQKKRRKSKSEDEVYQKKQEEKEAPEVSKETFYKVTENLKESLHEKQEFSLLNMFGKRNEEGLDEQEETETVMKMPKTSAMFMNEPNPFRYDSSDDEEMPTIQQEIEQKPVEDRVKELNNLRDSSQWSEPFFFKRDDYRLQEGFDFIEKMRVEDRTEFSKIRRDVKEIVKAKVRNNQRKNKPFKKKLGGNKRKKMIRMKKALKR